MDTIKAKPGISARASDAGCLTIRVKYGERVIVNGDLVIMVDSDGRGRNVHLHFVGSKSKYQIKREKLLVGGVAQR